MELINLDIKRYDNTQQLDDLTGTSKEILDPGLITVLTSQHLLAQVGAGLLLRVSLEENTSSVIVSASVINQNKNPYIELSQLLNWSLVFDQIVPQ